MLFEVILFDTLRDACCPATAAPRSMALSFFPIFFVLAGVVVF
jgi:hypothetical protein